MANSEWIASDDQGSRGTPGQQFSQIFAGIKRAKNGQYELHVRSVWGSNQGYLEEHGREERKFRADSLDDLLKIGIAELRGDEAFADPRFAQAIRNATYEAQDADADPKAEAIKEGADALIAACGVDSAKAEQIRKMLAETDQDTAIQFLTRALQALQSDGAQEDEAEPK